MARVVIINGYPGSGKDQFIQFCQEIDPTILNIHTSDKAKEALMLLGWDGNKTSITRALLASFMRASEMFDGPFKYVAEEISKASPNQIVFVHSREWSNVQLYKKQFGALTLFIDRPITNMERHSNPSDINCAENLKEYDWLIPNRLGLDRLKDQATRFMKYHSMGDGGLIC